MKLLSFVVLLTVILGNVNGISLQTKTEEKPSMLMTLPTDEKSLMSLLSQNNPSSVFLSLLGLKRKPHFTKKTVLKVIGLINTLIRKVHKKRSRARLIKKVALKKLQKAKKELLKTKGKKNNLKLKVKNLQIKKKNADINYMFKHAQLKAELNHLKAIKRQLFRVLSLARKRKSFLSEESSITPSKTSVLGESSEATSVLGLFSIVAPHKVQSIMNEVDVWINESLEDKKQLDMSSKLVVETLRKSELELTIAKKEEKKAENEKDVAQKKYDAIVKGTSFREDREIRLLQQIQRIFSGMVPDKEQILI